MLVTTAIAGAFLTLIGWISPEQDPLPLPPGELFEVPIEGDSACIELPFAEEHESYLLVISNLSRQVDPAHVELRSDAVAGSEFDRGKLASGMRAWMAPGPLIPGEASDLQPMNGVPPLAARSQASLPVGNCKTSAVDDAGSRCPQPDLLPQLAPERRFWLQVGALGSENPASYQQLRTKLAICGELVAVYVDESDYVPPETLTEIVRTFDNEVVPRLRPWLGTAADTDGDGRFCIVLTHWLGRLDDGRLSLGGMVSPADFDPQGTAPQSNRADVLYLNANTRPGRHLATLLAHEYAHAVICSARQGQESQHPAAKSEESWLNEALAHVAENLQGDVWTNLDDRIAAKLASPHRGSIVVPRGMAAQYGRDPAIRGGGYLFLRWCVARYGPGLIGPLVHSRLSGIENLEAATGVPFEKLYGQYAVELFLDGWSKSAPGSEPIQLVSTTANPTPASAASSPLAMPSLRGKTGRHWLAGPAYQDWNLDEATQRVSGSVSGTSSCYTVLHASQSGPRRVHLAFRGQGCWQVTLVRLNDPVFKREVEIDANQMASATSTALSETSAPSRGDRQTIGRFTR